MIADSAAIVITSDKIIEKIADFIFLYSFDKYKKRKNKMQIKIPRTLP